MRTLASRFTTLSSIALALLIAPNSYAAVVGSTEIEFLPAPEETPEATDEAQEPDSGSGGGAQGGGGSSGQGGGTAGGGTAGGGSGGGAQGGGGAGDSSGSAQGGAGGSSGASGASSSTPLEGAHSHHEESPFGYRGGYFHLGFVDKVFPRHSGESRGFWLSFTVRRNSIRFTWPNTFPQRHRYWLYHSEDHGVNWRLVEDSRENTANSFTYYIAPHKIKWFSHRFQVCAVDSSRRCFAVTNQRFTVNYESRPSFEYFKANNTGPYDQFGAAVAINSLGTVMVVGAPYEDSLTPAQAAHDTFASVGAVYLYYRPYATGNWIYSQMIKPSNPRARTYFGASLSLSNDGKTLAVGTCPANVTTCEVNNVYIFGRNGSNFREVKVLQPSDAHHHPSASYGFSSFGNSVSLSLDGSTLAVGAPASNNSTAGVDSNRKYSTSQTSNSGQVYIFQRSNDSPLSDAWSQRTVIAPGMPGDGVRAGDFFGFSVALSGDGQHLAVGAPGDDYHGSGIRRERGKTSFPTYVPFRRFGSTNRGSVFIYARISVPGDQDTWQQRHHITGDYPTTSDQFGYSVSLSAEGRILAVGAPFHDSLEGSHREQRVFRNTIPDGTDAGVVYIYRRTGLSWEKRAFLKPPDPDSYDYFGVSVKLSANGLNLAVGSPGDDSSVRGIDERMSTINNNFNSGAVFFYRHSAYQWSLNSCVKPSHTNTRYDNFGRSLALSSNGNTLVVGSPFEDSRSTGVNNDGESGNASNSGAVYMFGGRLDDRLMVHEKLRSSSYETTLLVNGFYITQFRFASHYQARYYNLTTFYVHRTLFYVQAQRPGTHEVLVYSPPLAGHFPALRMIRMYAIGSYNPSSSYSDGRLTLNWEDSPGATYVFEPRAGGTLDESLNANNIHAIERNAQRVTMSLKWSPVNKFDSFSPSGTIGPDFNIKTCQKAYDWCVTVVDGALPAATQIPSSAYTSTYNQSSLRVPSMREADLHSRSLGSSLAISSNGRYAIVGASGDHLNHAGVTTSISSTTFQTGKSYSGAATLLTNQYWFQPEPQGWEQEVHFKASNSDASDQFGATVAISGDGNIVAIGAPHEDSCSTGINGNKALNNCSNAGAVYIYTRRKASLWTDAFSRVPSSWTETYIKASSTDVNDNFGASLALSRDGRTLAVSALGEDGSARGVNLAHNNLSTNSGAVYVFTFNGRSWSQQAYIKPNNTDARDRFGASLALGLNGDFLVVGAPNEDSKANTINGNQHDNTHSQNGAVYAFERANGKWRQETYFKPSRRNSSGGGQFGHSVSLSADAAALAVGSPADDNYYGGINSTQTSASRRANSGAVYVFATRNGAWHERFYIKSPHPGSGNDFGGAVSMSKHGRHLAVGAHAKRGTKRGLRDPVAELASVTASGAAYVYEFSHLRDPAPSASVLRYVKSPKPYSLAAFGASVAISANGNSLFVGEPDRTVRIPYSYNPLVTAASFNGNRGGALHIYGGKFIDQALSVGNAYRGEATATNKFRMPDGLVNVDESEEMYGGLRQVVENASFTGPRPTFDFESGEARLEHTGSFSGANFMAVHEGNNYYYPSKYIYHLDMHRQVSTAINGHLRELKLSWTPRANTDYEYYAHFQRRDGGFGDPIGPIVSIPLGKVTSKTINIASTMRQFGITGGGHATNNFQIALLACSSPGNCHYQSRFDIENKNLLSIEYFKSDNPRTYDYFGQAVAVDHEYKRIAIAAPYEDLPNGNSNAGAVYIYHRSTLNSPWVREAKLTAPSSYIQTGAQFGSQLDIDFNGTNLVVSAINEDVTITNVGKLTNAGAVHVFRRSGSSWSHVQHLTAHYPRAYDYFGKSVALSHYSSYLAVGNPKDDNRTPTEASVLSGTGSLSNSGSVNTYYRYRLNWYKGSYLKAPNAGAGDSFGHSVAIDRNGKLAVGAPFEDSNSTGINNKYGTDTKTGSGAVYLYSAHINYNIIPSSSSQPRSTWRFDDYIKASNTGAYDQFGHSVGMSYHGEELVVGAPGEDGASSLSDNNPNSNTLTNSGAAYSYFLELEGWEQESYIKPPNPDAYDAFGWQVAINRFGGIAVSSRYEDSSNQTFTRSVPVADNSTSNSGAVYFLDVLHKADFIYFLKAPNAGSNDYFGYSMDLTQRFNSIGVVVGAYSEDGGSAGINPLDNNNRYNSGAAYEFSPNY